MIAEPTAVATMVGVATAGLAVNLASRRRLRTFTTAQIQQAITDTRAELKVNAETPRSVDVVWAEAIRASCLSLAQVNCSLGQGRNDALPTIARHRRSADAHHDTFVLPPSGATMDFIDPRSPHHVVLRPAPGVGSITLDRRLVTAFVDQLGLALGRMDE